MEKCELLVLVCFRKCQISGYHSDALALVIVASPTWKQHAAGEGKVNAEPSNLHT